MSQESFETAVVELMHSIGMTVRRVRAAASSDEISWTETSVLRRLSVDGPSTTAELARAQGMRPQSMRMIVGALEELGLVERKPHATDGRQVNLALTVKGAAMQQRAGDAKRTWLAQAIGRLGEKDQKTLFEAGEIMKRMVEVGAAG